MRKTIFTFLIILMWSAVVQAAIPEMKFRRLDTRNGLSSSQVNCVFRDSKGYIWFGTAYGLNRYDGYRIRTFYSNKRDTTSMRDNYTDKIMEGHDGKLWLKQGMNYCVYDPLTERFERNAGRELEKYLGKHNAVEYVYIDSKKNYWVKYYEEGLFCYNPTTKQTTQVKMGYGDNELNPSNAISWMTDYGDKVVMTSTCGDMACIDGKKGKVVWKNKWMRENGGIENQNYQLHIDRHGNFWVATLNYTFIYIKKENRWYKQFGEFLHAHGITDVPEVINTWDIQVDKKDWLWAATDHEGLLVIDLKNNQVRQFQNSKYDESTISDNTLRHIYLDPNGQVWLGTYKNGANQYVPGMASIRNIEIGDVNTVCEDNYGNYWIGSNEKGIIVYDPKTNSEIAHYTTANSPMLGNIMVGSCRASDGSIWFGSYNGGLTRCIPSKDSPQQARIINYRINGQQDGLSNNSVWSVTEDKWHRIWIGTLGGGIQMLDLKTNKFRTWNTKNTNLPSDYITQASWIKKGWLMMGTSWFYCIVNPVSGKLINRILPDVEELPAGASNTACVIEDSRGLIWLGSSSGLCVYDQKTKQLSLLDMTDGLYGSSISSVIEDKEHTMWVVTGHGVSKVTPQKQNDGRWQFVVRSYNNRDGLQQAAYNQRSTYLTSNGLILIGGQGGLDIINPKALSDVRSKERPIFSGLLIFDEDVYVGKEIDGRVILEKALDEAREVTLRYNDQFTIQLGSDAGNINNSKRFVYKLDGFNENWVRTSELYPNILFNSLRAGDYTLRVRMLNDDGTIGEVESSIEITILPPFWRTRWAILLYVIFVALAALWWRRNYMKRQAQRMHAETLRREMEQKQWMGEMRMQMEEEKQTHSMGNSEKPEKKELVRQTTDVIQLLRQFCAEYQQSIGNVAKVSFLSTVKTLDADIAKSEFFQAIKILLDNSIKFSPGDCRISVGVACTQENKLQIQVADNGIGINDDYKAQAFDHIPGIEEIGLATVKDIIVAHDGDIRLEDNPGGGTIFFITIPIAEEIEEAVLLQTDEI